ncbi:hypothetical protein HQ584_08225 [Patescibacteria group bacterium]|nr:hypothetical protein [Patescibacteria group bacterium]
MAKGSGLTSRQQFTISQILTSSTHEEACKRAKLSKGTLYAWLKDEVFKAELKRQRDEVVKGVLDRLKFSMIRAVEELVKLVDTSRPELRRLVCKDIIDYGLKAIEFEDIGERLDKIEQYIGQRRG